MKRLLLAASFVLTSLCSLTPQDIINTHLPHLEHASLSYNALSGGKSGSLVTEITSSDTHWVYRHSSSFDKNQKVNEVWGLERASLIGLAPKTILALPEEGIAVVEFNPSSPSSIQHAQNNGFLQAIAQSIKTLQTLDRPPHQNLKKDDIHKFYQVVKKHPLFADCNRCYRQLLDDQALLEKSHRAQVFSHGDLSPANIFVSPCIQFIDFSEVDARDRFYDLAYFAFFHNLEHKSELFLLKSYVADSATEDDLFYYKLIKNNLIGQLALEFGSYFCYLEKTQSGSSLVSYEGLTLEELIAILVDPKSRIDAQFCLHLSLRLFDAFVDS